MSVNLCITCSDGKMEDFYFMGGADGGEDVLALAQARNFAILAGTYPIWFTKYSLIRLKHYSTYYS